MGGTPAPGGAAREGLEAQILDYWGLLGGRAQPAAAARALAERLPDGPRRAPRGRAAMGSAGIPYPMAHAGPRPQVSGPRKWPRGAYSDVCMDAVPWRRARAVARGRDCWGPVQRSSAAHRARRPHEPLGMRVEARFAVRLGRRRQLHAELRHGRHGGALLVAAAACSAAGGFEQVDPYFQDSRICVGAGSPFLSHITEAGRGPRAAGAACQCRAARVPHIRRMLLTGQMHA